MVCKKVFRTLRRRIDGGGGEQGCYQVDLHGCQGKGATTPLTTRTTLIELHQI